MKKLLTVGCSTTYGDDLPNNIRKDVIWPQLLSNHFNYNLCNLGYSGSSNQQILQNTILNSTDFDVIIVFWTGLHRFTLQDTNTFAEVNFNKNLKQTYFSSKEYFKTFGKYYYTYWNNDIFNLKNWLQNIIMLQSFLDNQKKQYHFFCSTGKILYKNFVDSSSITFFKHFNKIYNNIPKEIIFSEYKKIQLLKNLINFDTFTPPDIFNIYDNIVNKYPTGKTNHPLVEGHKHISKFVIQTLEKKQK